MWAPKIAKLVYNSNFDLLFTDISMLASAQHKLIEGSLEVELPTIWTGGMEVFLNEPQLAIIHIYIYMCIIANCGSFRNTSIPPVHIVGSSTSKLPSISLCWADANIDMSVKSRSKLEL